jgi:large subunit ribosomal protein L31
MKEAIHPQYHELPVVCTCGTSFTTGSTYKKNTVLKLEICGYCHPFYTGKQKTVDTDRRIDKFYSRYASNKSLKSKEEKNKEEQD